MFKHDKEYAFLRGAASVAGLTSTLIALPYVREKHKDQMRNDGTPYISHPLTMACHASALFSSCHKEVLGKNYLDDILTVCLLHDICEDCGVDFDSLKYNDNIVEAVRLLTFSIKNDETKEQAKVRYYNEILENETATMVKLIDRCHNVSTMKTFDIKRMKKYIIETREFVLPLLEKATLRYPLVTNQLFVLKYHILSMLNIAERCVNSESNKE